VPEVGLEGDSGPWEHWEVAETCGIRAKTDGRTSQSEVESVDSVQTSFLLERTRTKGRLTRPRALKVCVRRSALPPPQFCCWTVLLGP
jgi:hypothetical protein